MRVFVCKAPWDKIEKELGLKRLNVKHTDGIRLWWEDKNHSAIVILEPYDEQTAVKVLDPLLQSYTSNEANCGNWVAKKLKRYITANKEFPNM